MFPAPLQSRLVENLYATAANCLYPPASMQVRLLRRDINAVPSATELDTIAGAGRAFIAAVSRSHLLHREYPD